MEVGYTSSNLIQCDHNYSFEIAVEFVSFDNFFFDD